MQNFTIKKNANNQFVYDIPLGVLHKMQVTCK
jgi:hypothetical protein